MKPTNLTIKDLFNEEEKLTFLVGAGCSVDPPSCLPAGRSMMKAIINHTCAEPEIEKILKLEELRFEQLVEILRDNLDSELKIIDYYGQCDKPNLQHFFLADMIKKGHFVMTTNFDFLIEHALLQSNIPKDDMIPVITKSDFEKFINPTNLFEKGKKSIYKIHGSTKNIITDEDTRDSLIATIQAFGSHKEGRNVFQVEPFKRPIFDKISNNRTLVVMGYSGSDDFDIIPTLMVLKNLKNIIWINFIFDDGGSEKIFEINKTTVKLVEKSNKVNQILAKIYRMQNAEHIYRVDANTTRLVDGLIGTKLKPSSEMFSINPIDWLKNNIKVPIEIIRYAIPYRIYSELALYQDSMRCSKTMLKIAENIEDQSWKSIALYNIGKIHYAQGNYSEALKRCEEALTIDEQLGDPSRKVSRLVQIGLIFRAQGEVQKALNLFQDAMLQQCNFSERAICHKQIGEIYRNRGELDYALREFEEALRIDEKLGDLLGKATSLNDIGMLYQMQGKTAEALKRYEEALRIHEELGGLLGKANSLNIIAGIDYDQGNYEDALKKTEEAWEILIKIEATESVIGKTIRINLEEISFEQTAKYEISKILTSLHFENLGTIILNKFQDFFILKWKPQFLKYRDPKFVIPIIIYMYFRIHGYKITKSELLRVSDISSVDFDNFLMQLRNYLGSYDLHRDLQTLRSLDRKLAINLDDKKERYSKGIILDNLKRYAEVHFKRFKGLGNLNQYKEAIKSYDKTISIRDDTSYKKAWNKRGITLNNLKRYQEAVESFDKAIAIDPNYKDAWYYRGISLNNLKRYQEAVESFDKAIAIDPNHKDAWNNRGIVLDELKQPQQALESLDKALAIDPNYVPAWYNKACVESLQGNKNKAITYLRKAITLDNKFKEIAIGDSDFKNIKDSQEFKKLTGD